MKTKLFLFGIILGVALFTAGCKKVAGRSYNGNGSCSVLTSLMFFSSEMQVNVAGNTCTYTQDGDKITIYYGILILILNQDATGCLVFVSTNSPTYSSSMTGCKYCE